MHVKSQPFKNKIAATKKGTKAGHALFIQQRICHQCKGANRNGFIWRINAITCSPFTAGRGHCITNPNNAPSKSPAIFWSPKMGPIEWPITVWRKRVATIEKKSRSPKYCYRVPGSGLLDPKLGGFFFAREKSMPTRKHLDIDGWNIHHFLKRRIIFIHGWVFQPIMLVFWGLICFEKNETDSDRPSSRNQLYVDLDKKNSDQTAGVIQV